MDEIEYTELINRIDALDERIAGQERLVARMADTNLREAGIKIDMIQRIARLEAWRESV